MVLDMLYNSESYKLRTVPYSVVQEPALKIQSRASVPSKELIFNMEPWRIESVDDIEESCFKLSPLWRSPAAFVLAVKTAAYRDIMDPVRFNAAKLMPLPV
jgi:hypothetical protein